MGKRWFDRFSGNSISKHETSLAGHNECFFLISFITLSEIWFQRNSSFTCPSFLVTNEAIKYYFDYENLQ